MSENKTSEKGKAWLKREMRPYRASVVFLTVFSVLTTLLSLSFAYLIQYLINSATNADQNGLLIFAAVLLGVLLLKIFFQTVHSYCAEGLRAKMIARQRVKTYSKILRSDYAKISEYHSGDLLNRLTSDITEVAVDTVGLMPSLVGLAVQCVGAVAALLTLDPLFTAIYVVCGLLGGGIAAFFRKKIKRYHKDFMEADGQARSFIQEGLSSMLTIKAYGAEDRITEKTESISDRYYSVRMKRNALRTAMSAVFSLLSNVGLIFAIVWCSVGLLTGEITDFGKVLSIVLLLNQLQHPFSAVSSIVPVIYSRQASAERLQEIEDLAKENAVGESCDGAYEDMEAIVFENVSFDYGRESVLSGVDFAIKTGEIACITGSSGSGKSTLFKLLLSVYAPNGGEIFLQESNGQRTAITARERALFAYLPQGNFLFTGTIEENLTFFVKNKGEDLQEKIEEALKIACAQFVYELPEGLKTPLSERGAGLSEGQLQRLAIARALLSDRPILLLDEATSALDSETEERLLENIKSLKNKTCIFVTHRLAALSIADVVYELHDGTIRIK
ncbi:MAG: ABC transporter ATP-binding protein [Clostridia bacterium]|nr:ABC transporter ATP-binding protein [Clostridia bacterium]